MNRGNKDSWRYSIVENPRPKKDFENAASSLDNLDPEFGSDDFNCCGTSTCIETCNCKYPFELINFIAAFAHLVSLVVMSVIYAGLEAPLEVPYTETFIKWDRVPACTPKLPELTTTTNAPVSLKQNANVTTECLCAGANQRPLITADGERFCLGPKVVAVPDSGVNLGILIIAFHALSFLFQGAAWAQGCCCRPSNKVLPDEDEFEPLIKTLEIQRDDKGNAKTGCIDDFFDIATSYLSQLKCSFKGICGTSLCGFRYKESIASGKNYLRFIEYAFSASIMLIAIALLNGVFDINLIACIAVLTAATQICGIISEYLLAENADKYFFMACVSHAMGWLLFFCAYGVIFHAFIRSATDDPDVQPPDFVWVIVFLIFGFYGIFGAVQLTELCCLKPMFNGCCSLCDNNRFCRTVGRSNIDGQITRVKRCNYQCKEMSYVIMSLASKLSLGWLIYVNFLIRSD